MNKEFVSYEQAVALKELGFDESCLACFINGEIVYGSHTNNIMQRFRYAAPLKQQVFRWFREYSLLGEVQYFTNGFFCYTISNMKDTESRLFTEFQTYEEAQNACIDKLIELANQQEQ